jgi:prepilin-type N-terminal cleavage/methylation domain-containing protein
MSPRARRGMTLMELVIGLAITGMMAAAGAGTFASIIDHRRTIQQASLSIERAASLREMLHSWLITGSVQIQRGGGPRGLTRGVAAARPAAQAGTNIASVSAAQASGDELNFTTTALNPSLLANVRMRLYIDGDNNTPEKGLTIEYQPNARMPLVRRMLDSTIDTLRVEFLDGRTHRWLRASEAATLTPHAFRVTLLHGEHGPLPAILELPMVFLISDFSMQVRR